MEPSLQESSRDQPEDNGEIIEDDHCYAKYSHPDAVVLRESVLMGVERSSR